MRTPTEAELLNLAGLPIELRGQPDSPKEPKYLQSGLRFLFKAANRFQIGWDLGEVLTERLSSDEPLYLNSIDPATGAVDMSVDIQILTDNPEEYWPLIIEEILESPGNPRRTTDEDRADCAEAFPDVERIRLAEVARAESNRIHQQSILPLPGIEAGWSQTISVLVVCDPATGQAKWSTAGLNDLNPEQEVFARTVLSIEVHLDPTPGLHAEPKVFYHTIAGRALVPLAIGTSNGFCEAPLHVSDCLMTLGEEVGAIVLAAESSRENGARRRAYWPGEG